MTGKVLDPSTWPFRRTYTCKDQSTLDLDELVTVWGGSVDQMGMEGKLRVNDTGSFGFAMLMPLSLESTADLPDGWWDMPDEFVWFVSGWGSERDRYIANAIRKLRPLLRWAMETDDDDVESTSQIRLIMPDFFTDVVDSKLGEPFVWGDFPWGGAVVEDIGEYMALVGAVSGFSQFQDESVARLILGEIKEIIVEGDGLLPA